MEDMMEKYNIKHVGGGEFAEGFYRGVEHMERWIKKKKLTAKTGSEVKGK